MKQRVLIAVVIFETLVIMYLTVLGPVITQLNYLTGQVVAHDQKLNEMKGTLDMLKVEALKAKTP